MKPPRPGLVHEVERVVTRELCARPLRGLPPVLATAEMIRLMEVAAYHVLDPFYEDGESSVGTAVEVHHTAVAPLGARVRARARLVAVDGRRCTFAVEAFDEAERIGHGTHERFVVDVERLRRRVEGKLREGGGADGRG